MIEVAEVIAVGAYDDAVPLPASSQQCSLVACSSGIVTHADKVQSLGRICHLNAGQQAMA